MRMSPVNRGVTCRRDAGDSRPTGMDVLDAAIVESPYLLQKIQGQQRLGKRTWRYRARQIDFEKFEAVLGRASAGAAEIKKDIFGDWRLWPTSWSSEEPTEQGWDEADDRERTRAPWSTSSVEMAEPVDVESLRRYFQSGDERRPDRLVAYLKTHDAHGEKRGDGLSYLRQRYSPKAINGGDLGRWYSGDISLQSLTREARREACLPQYVEMEIANCFATCILLMYHGAEFPTMRRYCDPTEVWRAAVSEYYGVDRRQAKGVILRALYGYPNPSTDFAASHVMPIVEWIAEDATRERDMICADRPELLDHFSRAHIEQVRDLPPSATRCRRKRTNF